MEKGLYINVTPSGFVFDRTKDKNERLAFGVEYPIFEGSITVTKDNAGKTILTCKLENGEIAYIHDITTSGLYYVWTLCVIPFPKTTRAVRTLYNQLKELAGKPKFKITENIEYPDPVKVTLLIKYLPSGKQSVSYLVKVNTNSFCVEDIQYAVNVINDATKLHLGMILRDYPVTSKGQEIKITINEEFLKFRQRVEKSTMQQVI